MANLKQLRLRIRSVSSTKQITKAMKMVAAAKLRRSQERATAARPYSQRMNRMMRSLATIMTGQQNTPILLSGRGGDVKNIEIVVLTADRGLCGSFNSGVTRAVRSRISDLQKEGFNVTLTCVGRKGHDVLKRQFGSQIRKVYTNISHRLTFNVVEREVARDLVQAFEEQQFDACYLVYNTFKSAMSQVLTWQQLIPLSIENQQDSGNGNQDAETEEQRSGSYLFEPDEEELLNSLLPRNIAVQLFQALVESDASEHGARMTAMDNAVRNASEMIRKLNIKFNRTRQAAITTELMEIIGGAESLKG
jgi:F-type H+-transporting ATPase subunit gamma